MKVTPGGDVDLYLRNEQRAKLKAIERSEEINNVRDTVKSNANAKSNSAKGF
jgi:hypothetical protein